MLNKYGSWHGIRDVQYVNICSFQEYIFDNEIF